MKKIIKVSRDTYEWKDLLLHNTIQNIEVEFNIHPFQEKYMAFMEVTYSKNKTDYRKKTKRWNSLWKLWAMSFKELEEKINSYQTIWQVLNEFDVQKS